MRSVLRKRLSSDSGITLIELMIYIALGAVVISVVGSVMIQSFRVQDSVQTSNSATGDGQLVIASIQTGVRNASVLSMSSTSDGELLIARTNNSAGAVSCKYRAWYYASAGTGSIYTKSSATAITAPTTSAALSTWTRLTTGVSRSGTTAIFATSAQQVDVRFNVAVRDSNPVPFKTTIISRGTTLESYQCS